MEVVNGGSQHSVVERVDYCFVPRGGEPTERGPTTPGCWRSHDRGFVQGKDYYLRLTGAGFPLGTGMRAYGRRFVGEIDQLRLRLRVTDAVGTATSGSWT